MAERIAVIDYGAGNLRSVAKALEMAANDAGIAAQIVATDSPSTAAKADRIVLPGVGAYGQCATSLRSIAGMEDALSEFALEKKRPFLGICVGMQLLAKTSEEGTLRGLGWIDGSVKKFDHARFHQATHLPHMGWNNIEPKKNNKLLYNVDLSSGFYFLHSYYFFCHNENNKISSTDYGGIQFTSAVQNENIYGIQFHPEKSHQWGIQLLKNFAEL